MRHRTSGLASATTLCDWTGAKRFTIATLGTHHSSSEPTLEVCLKRGSVRRRSRGSWEPMVDLGRDAGGKRLRQFRTVRGTKAEAERALNDMLRAADLNWGVVPSGVLLSEFVDRWLEDQDTPDCANRVASYTAARCGCG